MSEMIERVAQAMHDWTCLAIHHMPPWDKLEPEHREQRLGQARAAIEAMREPNEAMKLAGFLADEADRMAHGEGDEPITASFQAMIDTALKEPPCPTSPAA